MKRSPNEKEKKGSQSDTYPRIYQILDSIGRWALVIVLAVTLLILAGLFWVWADFLATGPKWAVVTWAIVATLLIFVALVVGFFLGHAFGAQKTEWFLQGATRGAYDLASIMSKFGTSAADVRTYTAKMFGLMGNREAEGSQEFFIDQLPSDTLDEGAGKETIL